jgi:hypothetical protein
MLRLYLYARVRLLLFFARETAGAASTRRSLRPLLLGRNDLQGPGERCRGNAEVCFVVIASAAKQSTLPLAERWIASLRSQ